MDLIIGDDDEVDLTIFGDAHCILVDEAQFLSPEVIDQLRHISTELDVPVICYGLRGDFRTKLFPGSQRLMELADAIEEIKTTCYYCNSKAMFNLKLIDGVPTTAGPTIDLGTEEKYLPTCARCYSHKIESRAPEASEPAVLH